MTSVFQLQSFTNENDLFHLARTTISSEHDLKLHQHNYVEIFWIKEGNGTHLINGQEITLKPGSFWIIRPNDRHTFRMESKQNGLVVTNIAFQRNDLLYYIDRYISTSIDLFNEENDLPYHCTLEKKELNELSNHTDKVLSAGRSYLQLDHVILHLFTMLQNHQSHQSDIPHWLTFALKQFSTPKHFVQGIPGFVELTGKSTDYVNRVVKSHYKQTLTETINNKRLEFASNQLIYTNTPIKIITSECGFASVSYFHNLFKENYGMTPKEYRARNHKMF